MYQIQESVFRDILKRKFSSVVGVYLEQLEELKELFGFSDKEFDCRKEIVKKITYEAMREVENQVHAFSKGVVIGVEFIKPVKE